MTGKLRVIDGGESSARREAAVAAALVAASGDGTASGALRIYHVVPTVVVGRHQATWDTVNMEACLADGIAIARRTTGGGVQYLDHSALGWTAVLPRGVFAARDLNAAMGAVLAAVQSTPLQPGADDPLTCSIVGARGEGGALLFEGLLARPRAEPSEYIISSLYDQPPAAPQAMALDRVHALAVLAAGLADTFQLMPEGDTLSAAELADAAHRYRDEIGTDEFVFLIDDPTETGLRIATHRAQQGTLHAYLRTGWQNGVQVVTAATITGDFMLSPPERVGDIERAITGQPSAELSAIVDRVFDGLDMDLAGVTRDDFKSVFAAALKAEPLKNLMPLR